MIMTDKDAEDFYKEIENIKKGTTKKYVPVDDRKTSCMRCRDTRVIYVYKDTSEGTTTRVDCPMCSPQRPPAELRNDGLI
jgi:hypothetical protein|tara:strand:+ start:970 stop:1209 length:240 start_codon:yes stop_codon:yes gene_type:complete